MKIFKTILPIVFILAAIGSTHGQKSGIRQARIDTSSLPEPHLIRFGITPSSLINEYVGLQMNGAVNVSNKFQFNLEAGWIFLTTLHSQAGASGFRLRPAVRMYLNKTSKYQLHFSVAYNLRKTSINRKERITFTGSNGSILTDFKQDITLKGIAYMIGVDLFANENLIIDLGVGLGIANLVVADIGIPQGVRTSSSTNTGMDLPGDYQVPLVILNLKVQYLIH